MRVVDEETRKLVMQNRIDALEGDNLFDSNFLMNEEVEDDNERDAGEYVVEEAEQSEAFS